MLLAAQGMTSPVLAAHCRAETSVSDMELELGRAEGTPPRQEEGVMEWGDGGFEMEAVGVEGNMVQEDFPPL